MKNLNDIDEFGYKTRQILNHGADTLDRQVAMRLHAARQTALNQQRVAVARLSFAGVAHMVEGPISVRMRGLLASLALVIGIACTYYWNAYQQVAEYEEIDSALLADELPPSAYLDRGFHAWLERNSR